jgi:antitoxin component of MazEF toxin-antitoxin module
MSIPRNSTLALDLKAGDKVTISMNDYQMTLEKARKGKG